MIDEFVDSYCKLLVNHPNDIRVEIISIDDNLDEVVIYACNEDVGRLIGKDGRMINSIKTFISGCKAKGSHNYRINVKSI